MPEKHLWTSTPSEPPPPYRECYLPDYASQTEGRRTSDQSSRQWLEEKWSSKIHAMMERIQVALEDDLQDGQRRSTIVLPISGQDCASLMPGQEVVGYPWDDDYRLVFPSSHAGSPSFWSQEDAISTLSRAVDRKLQQFRPLYFRPSTSSALSTSSVALEKAYIRYENSFGLYNTRTVKVLVVKVNL